MPLRSRIELLSMLPSRASGRWVPAVLTVALVAVGLLAWSFYLRPQLRVDASALAGFPKEIGVWRAEDIPVQAGVESMLQADFHVQRVYMHPLGEVVWLYVGYYGTSRGGRPEHVPRTCYNAQGWRVEAQRRLEIDSRLGLRANEYVVERNGELRLVHFWYRSYRGTGILDGLGLSVDHLVGRLLEHRADGALVRISTPLGAAEDVVAARSRLAEFGATIEPLLDARWPTEVAIPAGG